MALPVPRFTPPVLVEPEKIISVLAPMLAMPFCKVAFDPSPISVMAMTAATAMMTPKADSPDASCVAAAPPRRAPRRRQQRRPVAAARRRVAIALAKRSCAGGWRVWRVCGRHELRGSDHCRLVHRRTLSPAPSRPSSRPSRFRTAIRLPESTDLPRRPRPFRPRCGWSGGRRRPRWDRASPG